MELSEGVEAREGLEMRKVNSKFPANGVDVGLGGKRGELGLPMPDSFSSSANEEKSIHAQITLELRVAACEWCHGIVRETPSERMRGKTHRAQGQVPPGFFRKLQSPRDNKKNTSLT